MFKRKKYLVKNEATGLYAGDGWGEKKKARKFKKKSDARYVALVLTFLSCDRCSVVRKEKA